MKTATQNVLLRASSRNGQDPVSIFNELPKISVFLVDDDALYAQAFCSYLKNKFKSEIALEVFGSGEDCLKVLAENPQVDLVILDYCLTREETPEAMNGIGVLKKIKKINSDIAVIMLSAKDKASVVSASLRYGARQYIVKSKAAFSHAQNVVENLFMENSLLSYYPVDIGGEG